MWFRIRTAMAISVFRRSSVQNRRLSPITRFQRLKKASTRAPTLYREDLLPPALAKAPAKPCVRARRCPGGAGRAVSGWSRRPCSAPPWERGGTTTAASGVCSATASVTPVWSYAPSATKQASGSPIWSSRAPTCAPSSTSWSVRVAATIPPLAYSIPAQARPVCEQMLSLAGVVGDATWRDAMLAGSSASSERSRRDQAQVRAKRKSRTGVSTRTLFRSPTAGIQVSSCPRTEA